jgi:hypothetical protein
MLHGRVLRCGNRADLAQEIHALLIAYQLLQLVMARAGTAAGLRCTNLTALEVPPRTRVKVVSVQYGSSCTR